MGCKVPADLQIYTQGRQFIYPTHQTILSKRRLKARVYYPVGVFKGLHIPFLDFTATYAQYISYKYSNFLYVLFASL